MSSLALKLAGPAAMVGIAGATALSASFIDEEKCAEGQKVGRRRKTSLYQEEHPKIVAARKRSSGNGSTSPKPTSKVVNSSSFPNLMDLVPSFVGMDNGNEASTSTIMSEAPTTRGSYMATSSTTVARRTSSVPNFMNMNINFETPDPKSADC